ncbi:hypothetical protein EMPS_07728 [Entomortierella parvispora]|uniref:Uncharacterized protein n=1 Tax=Entomortierella parvispora TaxID=205924 RepID=A0A9P3LYY6_9FUNG|nr:hypothetical protein EMPS_07728 [Entomortierella parvispora]
MSDHFARPTPYSQFCFFKSLSLSLYEYDWYNFVECWQAMVAENAPIPVLRLNLAPFFGNSKRLLPVFDRYMALATVDPDFLSTMTTVVMSTPLLIKVQAILRSNSLFSVYVDALKLDNQSASHAEVMRCVQDFLAQLPAPICLRVQRAFAEAEASDSMGLSNTTLDMAFELLHSDTQLYIDFLKTLQLNQTRNMPWHTVVSKIKTLVLAKKPYTWNDVDRFLQQLHWGHFQQQYYYSGATAAMAYNEESSSSGGALMEDDDELVMERVEGVDYVIDKLDDMELGTELESTPQGSHQKHFPPPGITQAAEDSPSALGVADFSEMSISE